MKLNGRVVEGRIELEDDVPLPEGVSVEVTIPDSTMESYELTAEEDEILWQADQEIERGEYVTGEEFLEELRARRSRSRVPLKQSSTNPESAFRSRARAVRTSADT